MLVALSVYFAYYFGFTIITIIESPLQASGRVDVFELYENSRATLPDDKVAESEHLKNEGNRLMKEDKYLEATQMYTKAIQIDPRNPIFYCNRAAAWTRLGDYDKSISDANLSLRYNPRYSKAFVRQGDAYFRMEKFKEAADAYQKAVAIEPENEDYKSKSAMAMQRSLQNIQASSGMPQNNVLMNMMSQIINNPGMQEFLPRLRQIVSDGDMANISSQMQNVMQDPSIWNNLEGLLMDNLGGAGGGVGGPPGNNNPGQNDQGNNGQ